MKKVFLAIAVVAISAGTVFAQDEVPVPDFRNTPYLLKEDNTLGKLERPTKEVKQKSVGFSYGASTVTFINIIGGKSPIQVDPEKAVFVIKLADAEVNPDGLVYFSKVVSLKKSREFRLSQSAAAGAAAYSFGTAKGASVQGDRVQSDFQKVGPGVYKFTPSTPLNPGTEYAIAYGEGSDANTLNLFCFGTTGVAPKKKK